MKRKKRVCVPYDYEQEIQESVEQLEEETLGQILTGRKKFEYATKTIKAGAQLEVEIYPEFAALPQGIPKKKRDPSAQRDLNEKNSRKECIRLMNENFGPKDYWATFSYRPGCEPDSLEAAQRNMKNYLRKLNYHRRKQNLSLARYIYVTEWEEAGKATKEIRCHHHIVVDGDFPRDQLESLWTHGSRNQVRRLDLDRHGLTGLGCYITKAPRGRKKWCASLDLKRPPTSKSYCKFTSTKVAKMAKAPPLATLEIAKKYPAYWLEETEIKCNSINGMIYISAKMRRKATVGEKVMIAPELLEGTKIPIASGGYFEVEKLHTKTESTQDWAWIKRGSKRYFVPLISLIAFGRRRDEERKKKHGRRSKNV